MIECIKDLGEQPPNSLKHLYGQKKKAARRAVATERVYAGRKDTERVEDGPDSADMEEERWCA